MSATVKSSLLQAIAHWANGKPNETALIMLDADGEAQISVTYGLLMADIRRAAWHWRQQGATPENVVLLAIGHSYDLIAAFLGAIYAGALPYILPYSRPHQREVVYERLATPVYSITTPSNLRHQLRKDTRA